MAQPRAVAVWDGSLFGGHQPWGPGEAQALAEEVISAYNCPPGCVPHQVPLSCTQQPQIPQTHWFQLPGVSSHQV